MYSMPQLYITKACRRYIYKLILLVYKLNLQQERAAAACARRRYKLTLHIYKLTLLVYKLNLHN
jgi:hypothetical protein